MEEDIRIVIYNDSEETKEIEIYKEETRAFMHSPGQRYIMEPNSKWTGYLTKEKCLSFRLNEDPLILLGDK